MHSFNSGTHLEPEAVAMVVETAAVPPEELVRAVERQPPAVVAQVPHPAAQEKAAKFDSVVCLLEEIPVLYSASAAITSS